MAINSKARHDLFQFTPLREGRRCAVRADGMTTQFQFTPLREGRLQSVAEAKKSCYFNSRPSARGDPVPARAGKHISISIHAPPRGATRSGQSRVHGFFIFQFTPLREGRRNQRGEAVRRVNISIHAPPRGATLPSFTVPTVMHFNSRPSARGDKTVITSSRY